MKKIEISFETYSTPWSEMNEGERKQEVWSLVNDVAYKLGLLNSNGSGVEPFCRKTKAHSAKYSSNVGANVRKTISATA